MILCEIKEIRAGHVGFKISVETISKLGEGSVLVTGRYDLTDKYTAVIISETDLERGQFKRN